MMMIPFQQRVYVEKLVGLTIGRYGLDRASGIDAGGLSLHLIFCCKMDCSGEEKRMG